MLLSGFTEHGRHQTGTEHTFGGDPAAAAGHHETCFAELLGADHQYKVVHAGFDSGVGFAHGGGAGSTSVGRITNGHAGLAELTEDLLTHHGGGVHHVAGVDRLDVFDADAGVVQGELGGGRTEFGGSLVGETTELDEIRANDENVGAVSCGAGTGRRGTHCLPYLFGLRR